MESTSLCSAEYSSSMAVDSDDALGIPPCAEDAIVLPNVHLSSRPGISASCDIDIPSSKKNPSKRESLDIPSNASSAKKPSFR